MDFRAEDNYLLVEVCDSSWARGLKRKLLIDAMAGIPECWFVRLRTRCVHRFTEPREIPAEKRVYNETDAVPMGGSSLSVSHVLPRPE